MTGSTTIEITLHFSGPYGWAPAGKIPCVFDAPVSAGSGIYLWSVPTVQGELVYYVGETGRSFADRLTEHLRDQPAGMYRIYEPSAFSRGEKRLLWGGMLGRLREKRLAEFVGRYADLAPHLDGFVRLMHFWLGSCAVDQRLRRRIEASLADHWYACGGDIGAFQDDDISYDRLVSGEPEHVVLCSSDRPIRGLPPRLRIAYDGP